MICDIIINVAGQQISKNRERRKTLVTLDCVEEFEWSCRNNLICGCSSLVESQPSKLVRWVRFPSPAPLCAFNSAG